VGRRDGNESGRGEARAMRRVFATALVVALSLAAVATQRGLAAEARILENVAYGGEDGARSLELYLPSEDAPAPLFVFVQTRFWQDDEHRFELARALARPLQQAGAAVALVRVRAAPDYQHPHQAQDLATAVAWLIAHANEYRIDPKRIVLAGRAGGAQLAALVALDPKYLEAVQLTPAALSGVAALSGFYELDPDPEFPEEQDALVARAFPNTAARREASPLRHVRKDAPLFLITFAENDLPGAPQRGAEFSEALRKAGHPAAETFGIPGRDLRNQLDLRDARNPMRQHLMALLELGSEFGSLRETFAMRRFWREPSFSSAEFWKQGKVATHDATPQLARDLNLLFTGSGGPPRLRPQRYHALDLYAWLERNAEQVGRGRYLTLTNARGEQAHFDLETLRPYKPQIVIGVDEQRELFQLVDFYHTLRRNTWQQPEPEKWILARPVGAFLHFAEPAPKEIDPRAIGRFALTPESFARSDTDPLAALRSLPANERQLLTSEFHCVSCHSFRGAGAKASHLRATDGARVGGYALPLEEYPPQVWKRYCFEQDVVAKEIGATPIALGADARVLFELVERERARAKSAP
jgi:acetyl esterase/lipase